MFRPNSNYPSSNPKAFMKRVFLLSIPLLAAFLLATPQAHAAKYLFGDNANLVKGCTATVEIKIDAEGSNVMAGDSTININSNEVQVNQVTIGSAMPMQVFNQVTSSQIKLSGARLPMGGAFTGIGTFGYITFLPGSNSNSGTFSFSPDLTADNTLANDNIENVLTSVENKTYAFRERYDKNVDGVGFCTPDTIAPSVQFVNPVPNAFNVSADTQIAFALTDDRSGVDMNSLSFTVDSNTYHSTSQGVAVTSDANLFKVVLALPTPFKAGAAVGVQIHVCDKSSAVNCTDATNTFQVFTTATLPAVCGDGVLNPASGEQCDHGDQNGKSGDSCSSLCLLVAPTLSRSATASCSDGAMNQDEQGLDCGGSCPNACPTCVDGLMNQSETGVDCGGPCPSCVKEKVVCAVSTEAPKEEGKPVPLETSTICHYPDNDPQHPYTMVIPKALLADYLKKGDAEGACSVDEMCNALRPVAPEVEKKAAEAAQKTVANELSVLEQTSVILAPQTQAVVVDQIAICKAIPDYRLANFDSASNDTDGDGLSDRTECYAKTSPILPDTDGDGCTDGDELNRFNTNPLDSTDCKFTAPSDTGFSQVLITDPKPSWTLGNLSPRFSGLAPLKTSSITITVFHADQKVVAALSASVNSLLQANSLPAATKAIADLKTATSTARTFVDLNGLDFNYADLQGVVSDIETKIKSLDKEYGKATSFVAKDYFDTLKKLGFGDIGLGLGGLLREPIVLGSTNTLSSSVLTDQPVSSFEILPTVPLEDQKLYDVVATATLGAKTTSSTPIQFGVNTGFTVSKPIPRTLGGQLIPGGKLSFGGVLIDEALAQSEDGQVQIEIGQARPVITGDTEFGSQVFAIWNSVVLSSSVISDSEQGAFEIQAPKDLETGVAHRVTLYAVKMDKNKTLRSESVDIYFRIKSQSTSALPVAAASTGILTLICGAYYLIRRMQSARSVIRLLKSSKR